MYCPLGPKPSEDFAKGSRRGFLFAQYAQIRDRHQIGPHNLTAKQAKHVVDYCSAVMAPIAEDTRSVMAYSNLPVTSEFLRGLHHGILCHRKLGANPEGKARPTAATTAYEIYRTLFTHQQEVVAMRSVPEVHRWLCQQLGENIVGGFDRTKKLCRRIGLRFYQRTAPQ